MKQPALDLFAPDVRPVSDSPVNVPIAPSADLTAKHCSSMGALKAQAQREYLWECMVFWYRIAPRTDAELAVKLHVAPSTISARRNELIKKGYVAEESCGTRKNPRTGVSNTLWQLAK